MAGKIINPLKNKKKVFGGGPPSGRAGSMDQSMPEKPFLKANSASRGVSTPVGFRTAVRHSGLDPESRIFSGFPLSRE